MSDEYKQRLKRWSPGLLLLAGALLGALLVLGIRFATYHQTETHYHANFAVFINGQREQFKSPQFYQEVKLCSLHGATPEAEVHLHNSENSVIHVHDQAVTWGEFFENMGWYVGPDFIRSPQSLYVTNGVDKLNIMLNGQDLTDQTNITSQVIQDKDRLLLSFGSVDQPGLAAEYKAVPSSAASFDIRKDPASCAGSHSTSVSERLQHLL